MTRHFLKQNKNNNNKRHFVKSSLALAMLCRLLGGGARARFPFSLPLSSACHAARLAFQRLTMIYNSQDPVLIELIASINDLQQFVVDVVF